MFAEIFNLQGSYRVQRQLHHVPVLRKFCEAYFIKLVFRLAEFFSLTKKAKICYIYRMMILVKGGTFQMGNPTGMADEQPVHEVTLDDFYIDDHLTTQAEWRKIMGTNPSYFQSNVKKGESQVKRPVERISQYDCFVYCNLKSLAEKLTPCYSLRGDTNPKNWGEIPEEQNPRWESIECNWDADGYRLPTEAEWEYASRGAGTVSLKKALKDADENRSWTKGNSDCMTHSVSLKQASVLGLYDLFGNLWEWCWDRYDCYEADAVSNPHGAKPTSDNGDRIARGGAWNADAIDCTPYFRNCGAPSARYTFFGLRVVRSKR